MSSMLPTSPFDIPEIASLIASYISKDSDLARCARVSRSLHDICVPILWKSIHFSHLFFRRDRDLDKEGSRVDLIRCGKLSLIEKLTINYTVRDDDMEMIAEHCTNLKILDFDGANVTAENLAILIPSDRDLTEDIDSGHKPKRRKIQFPSNLKFKSCENFAGRSCLEIVSLLGPQLTQLSLIKSGDITDQDMIKVVRRCPNLVSLQLEGTSITDEFLKNMAQDFLHSDSSSTPGRHKRYLEKLNVRWNGRVSSLGFLPVVMACRSTLKSLSIEGFYAVSDEVLFALVGDPIAMTAAQGSKTAPHLTTQANALKQSSNKTPFMRHQFSPNTVLTEIRLSQCLRATDAEFQVLFRFATELVSIHLLKCDVGDSALMVLAETYRNRMKALGLGVPAAWREHVLADERVEAMSRDEAAEEGQLTVSTFAACATKDSRIRSGTDTKVFTGGDVPGGLKRLDLFGCKLITNKGVRAILRSCVGLELLDIAAFHLLPSGLSLELFRGPWACSRLKHLAVSGLHLEIAPQDLGVIEGKTKRHAQYQEELVESSRFPLAIDPYPQEDDYDEAGNYDPMAISIVKHDDDVDVQDVSGTAPRQRAILRQFYSKLGQLSQLRTLNMNCSKFRVRVKDGLELILPGLQQNLTTWYLHLEHGNYIGNAELEFFGKHLGYGHDFTDAKDGSQDRLEGKTRQARLEHLLLSEEGVTHVRRDIMTWARRQGFHLNISTQGYWQKEL
ncbi:hypothetical protein EC968_007210 [Mortierella alpina]|nr:hypothetical protein EC968_007210 [Mortierella alpina]